MSPAIGFVAGVWTLGSPGVLVMVAESAEIAPGFCYWPPGTAVVALGFVGGHQGSRSRSGVRDFPDLLYILAEAVFNADQ